MRVIGLLGMSLLLAACHVAPSRPGAASPLAAQGKALAEANCSSCHAVGVTGTSTAPTFSMLVNEKHASAETLSAWLQGAHNYPQEMDFYLRDPEVQALVAYMLSLKHPAPGPSLKQMEGAPGVRR